MSKLRKDPKDSRRTSGSIRSLKIPFLVFSLPILGWLFLAAFFEYRWHNADPQHDTGRGFGAAYIYVFLPAPACLLALVAGVGTRLLQCRTPASR
jgi:hypothetical protein